jgi:hypothetical protein
LLQHAGCGEMMKSWSGVIASLWRDELFGQFLKMVHRVRDGLARDYAGVMTRKRTIDNDEC